MFSSSMPLPSNPDLHFHVLDSGNQVMLKIELDKGIITMFTIKLKRSEILQMLISCAEFDEKNPDSARLKFLPSMSYVVIDKGQAVGIRIKRDDFIKVDLELTQIDLSKMNLECAEVQKLMCGN